MLNNTTKQPLNSQATQSSVATHTPIPKDMKIEKGMYLIDRSGKLFRVLCNCGQSRPREHTQRYVNAHRSQYGLADHSYNKQFVKK